MSTASVVWSTGLALGLLQVFYRAVEFKWPASYFTVERSLERDISKAPARYALFRFGPVLFVATALSVVLARQSGPVVVPTLLLGVLHGLLTAGRAIASSSKAARRRRPMIVVLHVLVGVGCFSAAGAGVVLAPHARGVVPPGSDIVSSFWTAALTATLGAFAIRLVQGANNSPDQDPVVEGRRQLGELWDQAEVLANHSDADTDLVRAVMLVESQQRPSWARWLERSMGRFVRHGTYGPLQVSNPSPLSDYDALVEGIARRFRHQRVPTLDSNGSEMVDTEWLRTFLLMYNPSPDWGNEVQEMYYRLTTSQPRLIGRSSEYAHDSRPQVEVLTYDLDGGSLVITGTAAVYEGTLVLGQRSAIGTVGEPAVVLASGPDHRKVWRAEIEIEPDAVLLVVSSESAEDSAPDAGSVRLPILQDRFSAGGTTAT